MSFAYQLVLCEQGGQEKAPGALGKLSRAGDALREVHLGPG